MLSHNLVLLLCAAMTMLLLQWLLGSWVFLDVLGFMLSHNLGLPFCFVVYSYDNAFYSNGCWGLGCFWVSWVSCCLIILVCRFVSLCSAMTMLFTPMVVGVLGVFGCLGFHVVS